MAINTQKAQKIITAIGYVSIFELVFTKYSSVFFSFTTSNKVLCGTSCPDLQKTQEDAFKTQIRNEEGEIITKLKKIFNLEDNEIVGLTEKSFINGSLTISFHKIKIFDNIDKKDDELKKVDELIEAEMKNEENKDYYVYLDYINYQVQGKVINQDNKTSIYILIKNKKNDIFFDFLALTTIFYHP